MLCSYIACIHTLVNGKHVESSYILPLYKLTSSDFKVTFHYSDKDEIQCLEFKKEHIRKFVEYREGEFCKFLGLYIVKTIREALKIIIKLSPNKPSNLTLLTLWPILSKVKKTMVTKQGLP